MTRVRKVFKLVAEILTSWRTLSTHLIKNVVGEGNNWQERTMPERIRVLPIIAAYQSKIPAEHLWETETAVLGHLHVASRQQIPQHQTPSATGQN